MLETLEIILIWNLHLSRWSGIEVGMRSIHLVWLRVSLKLIKKSNVISHQPLYFRLSIELRGDREKTTGLPANKESSKVDGTQSLLDEM